jgi:gliding motility-associated lipoprotein GldH
MKPHLLPVCVFLSLLPVACTPGDVVFEAHQELSPDLQWNKAESRTFTIDITDNSHPYRLDLAFRYGTGFPYRNMMVRINETDPEGQVIIRDLDFAVRGEDGEPLGEPAYDIMDLTVSVDREKKFPVLGTYTYSVAHIMPVDTVHYAMEVGLVLRKPSEQR